MKGGGYFVRGGGGRRKGSIIIGKKGEGSRARTVPIPQPRTNKKKGDGRKKKIEKHPANEKPKRSGPLDRIKKSNLQS